MAFAGHDDGGGLGVVTSGGTGDLGLTGSTEEGPGGLAGLQRRGVVLPVPPVAQHGMVDTALGQQLLGLAVLRGQAQFGGVQVQQ